MALEDAATLLGSSANRSVERQADPSLLAEVGPFLQAVASSPYRGKLGLLAGGIVVVVCLNALFQIRLNVWQGAFFDAIELRDLAGFGWQLLVFGVIVGVLLVLVVAQTWLQEMSKVRLREWLTYDLVAEWLAPRRAYRLAFVDEIGVNPDQRMHEDARRLTELTADLGVGLLQSTLLLVSFVGVLWVLSAQVTLPIGAGGVIVPGYLVWCALAYSVGGSWLTWRVGRPLIRLNAERYALEAELRFALVRVSENAEAVSLYSGEPDERRLVNRAIDRVVRIMRRLADGVARLTWVTSGYGWLALVIPFIVAAPGYFAGTLSFGGLMMVAGAFIQVQQALRWFVDNFPRIADWRATLLRVSALRSGLLRLEQLGEHADHLKIEEAPAGRLELDDVAILLPKGSAALDRSRVEIAAGEHVLILGGPRSGKTTLFRALAGLWPWGRGTLRLPPRERMMFLPQRPYLPLGTLRAALAYPASETLFDDRLLRGALERAGLGHLTPSLHVEARWDRDLSLEEQQRLAFARLLVHKPEWVVMDDALGALAPEQQRDMLAMLARELEGVTIILIGHSPAGDAHFDTILRLSQRPAEGLVSKAAKPPAVSMPPAP
jgi:putative ATP-binding cassette transporter